ncbi:MAG: ABC transporter ATP-binding protein, partial [Myxococcaceae bacterium]|nr:ABC transporter ATP-binding protein [Myxococcaceae bacterium]
EREVQAAIDEILRASGRTAVVVAHRLSTVQNADVICVLEGGRVVERGTHTQLLQANGTYARLVLAATSPAAP